MKEYTNCQGENMAWIIDWRPWTNYSMWRAHRLGALHARLTIPIPEPDDVRGEGTYIDELRHFVVEVSSNASEKDSHQETKKTMMAHLEQEYREALNEYNQIVGKYSAEFRFAGWSYINPWVYYLLLILIFVGEIPLNAIVFRLFGEAEVLNFAVAFGLGVLLVGVAHLVGVKLKYLERTPQDWGMIFAALAFVMVILIPLIGFLRHFYLTRVEGEEANRMVTYAFIMIQYVIFWGAVLIAYAHHYPAERRKLENRRSRWLNAVVARQKEQARHHWEIQQFANSIDRLKDVYIGANLFYRDNPQAVPLVFYITDFDDLIASLIQQPEPEGG